MAKCRLLVNAVNEKEFKKCKVLKEILTVCTCMCMKVSL